MSLEWHPPLEARGRRPRHGSAPAAPGSLLDASAPNELVYACGQPGRRRPHFICQHRVADFGLFRESEKKLILTFGEELDNLDE